MKLKVIKGWNGNEVLIKSDPNEFQINKLMISLNWEVFNSVTLQKDENNWMNVSGNTTSEGLALVYQENGEIFVSKNAFQSIDELATLLMNYLIGDQSFNKKDFISTRPKENIQKNSKEYQCWKKRFEIQKEKEKKRTVRLYIASLLSIILIAGFLYLLFTDELRFIVHNTEITEARVTEINWQRERWGAMQHITYEFPFDGKTYTGSFKGNRLKGKFFVDEIIMVKFATKKPQISKRINFQN